MPNHADNLMAEHIRDYHPTRRARSKVPKENVLAVFNRWNSHRGTPWKHHPDMSYEMEHLIKDQLKCYSTNALCKAIDNYAMILKSKDYTWSHAWTLPQFLTRSNPKNRLEKQLWRFLPNSFYEKEYLTKRATSYRIEQRKQFFEFIRVCDEEKLIEAYKVNKNNLNWFIDEVRPEIKNQCDELIRKN